jgi:hypothetical protein
MICTVNVSLENREAELSTNPKLDSSEVSWQSELFYELLVPSSRRRYDGQRRNLFGFLEWRFQLEDSVFFNLVEQEITTVESAALVAYLTSLIELIERNGDEFPSVYTIRAAVDHQQSKWLKYVELNGGKVEAGYDYCLAEVNGVWHDLRAESSFEAVDSSGRKKRVEINALSFKEAFSAELGKLLQLAEAGCQANSRIVLATQQTATADETIGKDRDDSASSDVRSDEEQLGIYMKMVSEIPIPTPDEEEQLVSKIEMFGQAGADARKRLMQGYFRLVLSLATKYLERGLRLLDLIAAANQALAQATERYDFASGISFSSYATWKIESELQKAVGESVDPLPSGLEAKLKRAKELSDNLKTTKGRPASEKELAEAMGMNVEELRRLFEQV